MNGKRVAIRAAVGGTVAVLATVGLIGTAQAAPGVPNIAEGSSNSHGVWCVQYALNNFYDKVENSHQRPLSQDGVFGPQTADMVRWFQAKVELGVDGIVGPDTGEELLPWDADKNGTAGYCWKYVPTFE